MTSDRLTSDTFDDSFVINPYAASGLFGCYEVMQIS